MKLSQKERLHMAFEFKQPDRIPIFFLEQTARYIPEINDILTRELSLKIAKDPQKAAELTLTAYRKLKVDAILPFSHTVLLVEAMGFKLRWNTPPSIRNREPAVTKPLQTMKDIQELRVPEPARDMAYKLEEINLLFQTIGKQVPIFASIAAPFTTAAWLRGIAHLKSDLIENPDFVHTLQAKLLEFLPGYVEAQRDSGASVAIIYDWAVGYGSEPSITLEQYREFVLPYQQKLFSQLKTHKIPTILWISNTQQVFEGMVDSKADIINVDTKTDFREAKRQAEGKTGLLGNLDPHILHQNAPSIEKAVKECIRKAAPGHGYIFSTGGRVVRAPLHNVLLLVELAKRWGAFPLAFST